ncbi:cytochrome d ubiquinol oxidase subunit II [Nonomuraea sp. NPDC050404]|uniref:cytochrome d ubiquinol oxidase subunit II n=1 Tax=Nonomuraea sp. NPDC050404 TaxID=3155783 RepID=UPI0033D91A2F
MEAEILLWILLGVYFVTDGWTIGAGLVYRGVTRAATERRAVLTSIGPFFLGGEVWLVTVVVTLPFAYPLIEHEAPYPLIGVALLFWVTRDVSIWFRSRLSATRWRAAWDWSFGVTSVLFALSWGLIVGLAVGGRSGAFSLSVILWTLALPVLWAAHGGLLLVLRLPLELVPRAAAVASRLLPWAATLFALASAAAVIPRSGALYQQIFAVLGTLALLAAWRTARAERHGPALGLSSAALVCCAGMVVISVAQAAPGGAANPGAGLLLLILPVLAVAQAWMWWAFRRRVDDRTPVFF